MFRHPFWLFVSFFVLAPTAFTTAQAQDEPPASVTAGQVVAVEFRGNHSLSSDELRTVVTTKATKKILGVFGSGPETLSIPTLERDTAYLNQYYRDRGFIDARSSFQVEQNHEDYHNYFEYIRRERLTQSGATGDLPQIRDTVTYTIQEGKPYHIGFVTIEGLESLPNEFQTELNEGEIIKSGQQWSRTAAAKEVQRLTNILIENGYPNVRSDSIKVQNYEGSDTVNVLLYIHPGHRFRYGPIHIVYDTAYQHKARVKPSVILAQLYIDSGRWYKLSEIQRSESALNNLGVFDLFRVSLDTNYINSLPDSLRDGASVPVEVFLRMKSPGQIPLGIGVGESSQKDLLVALNAGLTYRNFFDLADKFDVQGSWQFLPTSQIRISGNLDYTLPSLAPIGLGRIPATFGLGYLHQIETVAPATDTFISYSAHLGTNVILSHTDNKTSLTPDFLVAYVITTSQDSQIRATAPPQQINMIPSISYQDNRANDLINPTSGNIISATFELGVPSDLFYLFTGQPEPSSDYLKFVPQVKNYFDLSHNGTSVIATRLQVGVTYLFQPGDTSRDPSLDRRFYGGGAISNRGWNEQSLLVSSNPQQSALDGGFNDLEANVEFRFAPFQYPAGAFTTWQQFSTDIRLVLFYDIGNVWDNVAWSDSKQALAFNMYAQSIGWGLRYNTFFGAIRVDWGFKFYDPSGQFINTNAAITPGMHGEWLFNHHPFVLGNVSAFHFGIGQAF